MSRRAVWVYRLILLLCMALALGCGRPKVEGIVVDNFSGRQRSAPARASGFRRRLRAKGTCMPYSGTETMGGIDAYVIDPRTEAVQVWEIVQRYWAEGYSYPVRNTVGPEIVWPPDERYAVTQDIGGAAPRISTLESWRRANARFNGSKWAAAAGGARPSSSSVWTSRRSVERRPLSGKRQISPVRSRGERRDPQGHF